MIVLHASSTGRGLYLWAEAAESGEPGGGVLVGAGAVTVEDALFVRFL